jgi:hypothetical protein
MTFGTHKYQKIYYMHFHISYFFRNVDDSENLHKDGILDSQNLAISEEEKSSESFSNKILESRKKKNRISEGEKSLKSRKNWNLGNLKTTRILEPHYLL